MLVRIAIGLTLILLAAGCGSRASYGVDVEERAAATARRTLFREIVAAVQRDQTEITVHAVELVPRRSPTRADVVYSASDERHRASVDLSTIELVTASDERVLPRNERRRLSGSLPNLSDAAHGIDADTHAISSEIVGGYAAWVTEREQEGVRHRYVFHGMICAGELQQIGWQLHLEHIAGNTNSVSRMARSGP